MPERHYVPAPHQPGVDLRPLVGRVLCHLWRHPGYHARHLRALLQGLCPEAQQQTTALHTDRRFQHPGWQQGAARWALGIWLASCAQGRSWLQGLPLEHNERQALDWLGRQLAAASAPSNSPLNPEFIQQLRASQGRSLLRGISHLLSDLSLQRPLAPLNADTAFHPGHDLASTPGAVVSRQPLYELLHYQPTTPEVHGTPLLIIPPPLNRFYLLDLTRSSSLVQAALQRGQQVFMLSWRNPNPSHCNWGLDTYIRGIEKAAQDVRSICHSSQLNLLGVCSGGLLSLLLQAWLAARDELQGLASASYLITPLQREHPNELLSLAGQHSLQRLRQRIWRQGYLSARQLNAAFAWLRPEQLVWPQAVQRYALGESTADHPMLFWSQDNTRVAARLLDDLLHLFEHDPLARPGALQLNGCALDTRQITLPGWHLGAERDHLVAWQDAYPLSRLGGEQHFTLASGGHVQCLLNPEDCSRSYFRSGPVQADSQTWYQRNPRREGDWKPAWLDWLSQHSGPLKPAPARLGSDRLPVLQAAPGRYVHEL